MKIETILWLLVVMFMIHDFEEVIMMMAWRDRNADFFARIKTFKTLNRLFAHVRTLSTASFALAVAGMFVLLALCVWVSVEFSLYTFWMALLILYFVHLWMHIAQWLVMRKYVPVIWTSLGTSVYCIYALWAVPAAVSIDWAQVVWISLLGLALLLVYMVVDLRLAIRFEGWLQRYQKNGVSNEQPAR